MRVWTYPAVGFIVVLVADQLQAFSPWHSCYSWQRCFLGSLSCNGSYPTMNHLDEPFHWLKHKAVEELAQAMLHLGPKRSFKAWREREFDDHLFHQHPIIINLWVPTCQVKIFRFMSVVFSFSAGAAPPCVLLLAGNRAQNSELNVGTPIPELFTELQLGAPGLCTHYPNAQKVSEQMSA